MKARRHLALAVLGLLALTASAPACRNGRAGGGDAPAVAPATPTVVLHTSDGRTIAVRVELALNEAERARGLMFRNHMEPDAGMLFLFPHPGPLSFWMRNTLIPLDMLFIDHDRRVLGIVESATPETDTPRRVEGDSQYVLEIGGGLARQWGVVAGSSIELQGLPATAIAN